MLHSLCLTVFVVVFCLPFADSFHLVLVNQPCPVYWSVSSPLSSPVCYMSSILCLCASGIWVSRLLLLVLELAFCICSLTGLVHLLLDDSCFDSQLYLTCEFDFHEKKNCRKTSSTCIVCFLVRHQFPSVFGTQHITQVQLEEYSHTRVLQDIVAPWLWRPCWQFIWVNSTLLSPTLTCCSTVVFLQQLAFHSSSETFTSK